MELDEDSSELRTRPVKMRTAWRVGHADATIPKIRYTDSILNFCACPHRDDGEALIMLLGKPRVAFVDDEEDLAVSLADNYSNEYDTIPFTSAHEALNAIDASFAVVVADHRMPGMTGIQLLARLRVKTPDTVRVLLTAVTDIPWKEMVRHGIYYVLKSPLIAEDIKGILVAAVELYRQQLEAQRRNRTGEERSFQDLLGKDPKLLNAIHLGRRAAQHRMPVLITGETGTGKEVLARAIHFDGPFKERPFKAENCALWSRELVRSELFGKVKGAFTGSAGAQKGILREAEGGTVFLDEIGELPCDVQAALLRFLDSGEIQPVGYCGSENLRAHVRIIAATNRDLASAIRAGTFRPELFERLNFGRIHLPPLRERRGDIPELARHAVIVQSRNLGLDNDSVAITAQAMVYLQSLPFPGNVRELHNIIARALDGMGSNGAALELEQVRSVTQLQSDPSPESCSLEEAVDATMKQRVLAALKRHHYRQVPAAEELRISDRYLRELMKRFGISREE